MSGWEAGFHAGIFPKLWDPVPRAGPVCYALRWRRQLGAERSLRSSIRSTALIRSQVRRLESTSHVCCGFEDNRSCPLTHRESSGAPSRLLGSCSRRVDSGSLPLIWQRLRSLPLGDCRSRSGCGWRVLSRAVRRLGWSWDRVPLGAARPVGRLSWDRPSNQHDGLVTARAIDCYVVSSYTCRWSRHVSRVRC